MKINLKKYAKLAQREQITLHIQERLPYFILTPCDVTCAFQVSAHGDYDVLSTEVDGKLQIICQRCLEPFEYNYHHTTELAICRNEADAARYMTSFDCIVSQTGEVDLLEIITDELHLCGHEKHEDIALCQQVLSSSSSH